MVRAQTFVFMLAQIIGTIVIAKEICSCTPLIYEWTLDFQKECFPTNITVGPNEGIKNVVCSIEEIPFYNGTKNFVPIKIVSYQIIELNLELAPLKTEAAAGINLVDGDLITFASITTIEPSQFAGGFQVSLFGINSALQDIALEWIVQYSNICETAPYSFGDSIGWMVYVS